MSREIALARAIRGELQSRPFDALIAALAARQHGTVARRQLYALGLSDDAIDRRIAAGRLHRIHRGVYAVGHKRLTLRGRWMAAVLAAGPGAVLSHRSAAALHGLRRTAPATIEVTTRRTPPRTTSFVARRSQLQPDETEDVDGIPVTTVARTCLDLGATTTTHEVEQALREAEYLRLADATGISELLVRYPGRRGTANVRAALARLGEAPGRTRSDFEDLFLRRLDDARIRRPELNAAIFVDSPPYEVDCLWRRERIIVELDSYQAHGTRSRFESDRERDRKLALAGYRVIRMTWRQLQDDAVIRDLSAMLGTSARKARGRASRT